MNEPPIRPNRKWSEAEEYRAEAVQPTTGGSCLWLGFIWGTPTVVVPLILGLFGGVWPVGVALALGFLFVMGRMQSADFAAEPGAATNTQWGKMILYVVIQIVWIPMLWFAVVWGFCAVTGAGKF